MNLKLKLEIGKHFQKQKKEEDKKKSIIYRDKQNGKETILKNQKTNYI